MVYMMMYKEVQAMDTNLLFDGFITFINLLLIIVGPILFFLILYFVIKKAVKNAIRESRDSK
jgi:hypothetical protein